MLAAARCQLPGVLCEAGSGREWSAESAQPSAGLVLSLDKPHLSRSLAWKAALGTTAHRPATLLSPMACRVMVDRLICRILGASVSQGGSAADPEDPLEGASTDKLHRLMQDRHASHLMQASCCAIPASSRCLHQRKAQPCSHTPCRTQHVKWSCCWACLHALTAVGSTAWQPA